MLDTKAFPSSRPGFTIAAFPAFWIGTDSSTELQKEGSMLAQQDPSWGGSRRSPDFLVLLLVVSQPG